MPFSASSFLSSQQLLVIKYSTYIKICQWLHSNWWSLVQEATGLPQPLHNFKGISRGIISFALTNFLVPRYLLCRINFQLFINRSKFIHINQPKTFWQFLVHYGAIPYVLLARPSQDVCLLLTSCLTGLDLTKQVNMLLFQQKQLNPNKTGGQPVEIIHLFRVLVFT